MKDNDPNISDAELGAYLDGRHGVSTAHADLDRETTPEHLDRRILALARDSVAGKPKKAVDVYKRPYAIAATLFVCLAIPLILVDRGPESLTQTRSTDNAGGSPPINVELVSEAEPQTAPRVSNANRMEADAAQAPASADADDRVAAEPFAGLQDAAGAAREQAAGELRRAVQQVELEEITVTGNRIVNAPAYRENRLAWLEEIQRLRDTGEEEQAASEIILFLEAYPGTDVETALGELPP